VITRSRRKRGAFGGSRRERPRRLNEALRRADTRPMPDDPAMGCESTLASLDFILSKHPDAPVGAVDPDGMFVPVPETLRLARHRRLDGRSALDLVLHEDRVVVIAAWERARAKGASEAPVRLANEPGRPVILHIFDARAVHGVFVCVFSAADGEDETMLRQQSASEVPRLARARKSELGVTLEVEPACLQILGWHEGDLVGRRSLDFVHPDDQELAIDNWMEMLASRGIGRRVRLRHLRKDGSWVWMEITNHNLLDDPRHGYVLSEMADISEEMAVLDALRSRDQLLDRLAEALPVGVLQVGSNREIAYTNGRLSDLLGSVPGANLEEQLEIVAPEDKGPLFAAFDLVLGGGSDSDIEVRVNKDGGEPRLCTFTLRALTDEAGEISGAVVCVADVTDGARLRAELEKSATFDVLTECHNRSSIMARLASELAQNEADVGMAVMFVDLDRFKEVNDRLGHRAGDYVLAAAADRLRDAVRIDDLIGRVGGDEFLVICPRVRDSDEALTLAQRLARSIEGEIDLPGQGCAMLRASIGVAWSAGHTDSDQLVGCANAAMHESKREGLAKPVLALPGIDRRS